MKTAYVLAGIVCVGAIGATLMNTSAMFDFGPKKKEAFGLVSSSLNGEAEPVLPAASAIPDIAADMASPALPAMAAGRAPAVATEGQVRAGMLMQKRMMPPAIPQGAGFLPEQTRERFERVETNGVNVTKETPVSTFSVDVDTASYAFVRSALTRNSLPSKDAVRIEEMVNYFPYAYEGPDDRSVPFRANTAVFPTPWNKGTKILHIGIKGFEIEQKQKPHSNLVFLLDTSGSMYEENKLPLVQASLKLLLNTLAPDDTIAIVTYAGSAGIALEPTRVEDKAKILATLDGLQAGGSTAGAEGILTAYRLAEQHFDRKGINRVILATDGDFNVGITDTEELKRFVETKRESGVFLSVLGFGRGNYNDALMQVLAQNGNGNAAYIDNLNEARKVLVDEAGSTLFPIAKDVKIQVEFNPAAVSEYRLIGYETRILNREDFNNDKVDAGDIGSGHTVTALYEITPKGSVAELNDALRYKGTEKPGGAGGADEYAFVKIRYKLPDAKVSRLISTPVRVSDAYADFALSPAEARFATSVAAFGQLLRGESYVKDFTYDDVLSIANAAKGEDAFGYRAEFLSLVRLAKTVAMLGSAPKPSDGALPPPAVPY